MRRADVQHHCASLTDEAPGNGTDRCLLSPHPSIDGADEYHPSLRRKYQNECVWVGGARTAGQPHRCLTRPAAGS